MKPIDIERLLHWAYREELVKGGDIVSSSFGIIIRLGQLGTVVDHDQFDDVGKLPPIFGSPHRDAKAIEHYVNLLPYPAKPLVIGNASAGTRPHWYPQPIRVLPTRNGSRVHVVGECHRRDYYSTGSYCPLRFEPPLATVAHARAEYALWWQALAHLAVGLNGRLLEHRALHPGASPRPWDVPETRSRVLYSTAGASAHKTHQRPIVGD